MAKAVQQEVVEEPLVESEPEEPEEQETDQHEEAVDNLCKQIEKKLSQADVSELDLLHEVGTDIVNVRGEELYGPNITKEVAKRLNTYRQKIQFSVRLVESFDESGLDELRSMKTKDDKVYVWSVTHVRFLLRVKNVSERMSLAKECATNDWTCRKLQIEVQPASSASKSTKGPGADLTSSAKALLQFFQQWSDFVNQQSSPQTNLRDKVNALGLGKLTEKQRSLISSVASMATPFTEQVVQMNDYIAAIKLPQ